MSQNSEENLIYVQNAEKRPSIVGKDVAEDESETSQLWILRQLKSLLGEAEISEEIISDFIWQQDLTPFRNFMMTADPSLHRVLFITIERCTVTIEPSIDTDAIIESHLAAIAAERKNVGNKRQMQRLRKDLSDGKAQEKERKSKNVDRKVVKKVKKKRKRNPEKVAPKMQVLTESMEKLEKPPPKTVEHSESEEEEEKHDDEKTSHFYMENTAETADEKDIPGKDATEGEEKTVERDESNVEQKGTAKEGLNRKKKKTKRGKAVKKAKLSEKGKSSKKTRQMSERSGGDLLNDKIGEALAARSREESNKEILQELVQQEFAALQVPSVTDTRITLRWSDEQQLPVEDEFVYLLARQNASGEKKTAEALKDPNSEGSEFDRLYFVDYCPNKAEIVRIIRLGEHLLDREFDFERQIGMLVDYQIGSSATQRPIRWELADAFFENFICNSLVRSEKARRNLSLFNEDSGIDFMENLLRPRIFVYAKNPTKEAKVQLQLELSLYEMKMANAELFSPTIVERLQRALTILLTMQIFYLHSNRDWIQKSIFYCIELASRTLASNLQQRLWNLVGADCRDICDREFSALNDAEHRRIGEYVRPLLVRFLQLGHSCCSGTADRQENTEEFDCLEKIQQCLKIMDFIEEDFDKIITVVEDLHDTRRDMTFDRTKIDESIEIIKRIWNVFEESFFESSLESGNYEAMKNVYLQVSQLLIELKVTIPPLNEYCTH